MAAHLGFYPELEERTLFLCFCGAAFSTNDSSTMNSAESQPFFTPDLSAERDLEQTEGDSLGIDSLSTERLFLERPIEPFSNVVDDFSDLFPVFSSRISSEFSAKFPLELSFELSLELDVY